MQKVVLFLLLLSSFLVYSQTDIVCEYDESGNQVYRGEYALNTEINNSSNLNSNLGVSPGEIVFWQKVEIGPNPTTDILIINMNDEAKREISYFVLYDFLGNPQYTYQNAFTQSQRVELDMRRYPIGMYVLSFYLKDGKIFSKHISKQ